MPKRGVDGVHEFNRRPRLVKLLVDKLQPVLSAKRQSALYYNPRTGCNWKR
jgi:hypothetical protein